MRQPGAVPAQAGPLVGLHVVEMPAIGPAPMCAMMLADLGATVIRIARPTPGDLGSGQDPRHNLLNRSRRAVTIDLKHPAGRDVVLRLATRADVILEGFRPGVMERLGLGPADCAALNPRLIYGRVTGWGQDGPLAQAAAHDLNYIAISGALHAIGRQGQLPSPPLTFVGDFAGGAMNLAIGVLAALFERAASGLGQVVDAAVVDGAAALTTMFHGMLAQGRHQNARGSNMLDSGAFFYDVYECADGGLVAVAPIEQRFFDEFLRRAGLEPDSFPDRLNPQTWPTSRERLAAHLRSRTRAEWCALLEGSESCFAPVLSLDEAPQHAHNRARSTFVDVDGVTQPAPSPRFGRTPPGCPTPPAPDRDGQQTLLDWGLDQNEIDQLTADRAIA